MARTKAVAQKKVVTTSTVVGKKTPAAKKTIVAAPSAVTFKKKRRVRPGTKAKREIVKLQRGTDMLLQKAPFWRLVRELLQERQAKGEKALHIQRTAMEALQEAAEAALGRLFRKASRFAAHAKRETIMSPDLKLAVCELDMNPTLIAE